MARRKGIVYSEPSDHSWTLQIRSLHQPKRYASSAAGSYIYGSDFITLDPILSVETRSMDQLESTRKGTRGLIPAVHQQINGRWPFSAQPRSPEYSTAAPLAAAGPCTAEPKALIPNRALGRTAQHATEMMTKLRGGFSPALVLRGGSDRGEE